MESLMCASILLVKINIMSGMDKDSQNCFLDNRQIAPRSDKAEKCCQPLIGG
jgi:hypothetical protein